MSYFGINRKLQPVPLYKKVIIDRDGPLADVDQRPLRATYNGAVPTTKWQGTKNPITEERNNKQLEAPPLWKSTMRERKYGRLYEEASRAPEGLKQALMQAIAAQEKIDLDKQISNQINEETVEAFQAWLMGLGKPSDHMKAGWWPKGKKRPQWLKENNPISSHPSVVKYLEQFTAQRINYEKEIAKLKMDTSRVKSLPIERLWEIYKFYVLGMDPKEEINDQADSYMGRDKSVLMASLVPEHIHDYEEGVGKDTYEPHAQAAILDALKAQNMAYQELLNKLSIIGTTPTVHVPVSSGSGQTQLSQNGANLTISQSSPPPPPPPSSPPPPPPPSSQRPPSPPPPASTSAPKYKPQPPKTPHPSKKKLEPDTQKKSAPSMPPPLPSASPQLQGELKTNQLLVQRLHEQTQKHQQLIVEAQKRHEAHEKHIKNIEDQHKSEKDTLTETNQMLQSRLSDRDGHIRHLQNKLTESENQRNSMINSMPDVSKFHEERTKLNQQILDLHKNKDELNENLREIQSGLDQFKSTHAALKSKADMYDQLHSNHEKLQMDHAILKADHDKNKTMLDSVMQNHTTAETLQSNRIHALESEKSVLNSQLISLSQQHAAEIGQLQSEHETEKRKFELQKRRDDDETQRLRSKAGELESELQTERGKVSEMERDISGYMGRLERAQQQYEQDKIELSRQYQERLIEVVSQKDAERDQKLREMGQRAQKFIDDKQAELDQLKESKDEVIKKQTAKLTEFINANREYVQHQQQLEEANNSLQNELERLRQGASQNDEFTRNRIVELSSQIQLLTSELASLRSNALADEQAKEQLKQNIAELNTLLESEQGQHKQNVAELQTDIEKLHQQGTELIANLSTQKGQLESTFSTLLQASRSNIINQYELDNLDPNTHQLTNLVDAILLHEHPTAEVPSFNVEDYIYAIAAIADKGDLPQFLYKTIRVWGYKGELDTKEEAAFQEQLTDRIQALWNKTGLTPSTAALEAYRQKMQKIQETESPSIAKLGYTADAYQRAFSAENAPQLNMVYSGVITEASPLAQKWLNKNFKNWWAAAELHTEAPTQVLNAFSRWAKQSDANLFNLLDLSTKSRSAGTNNSLLKKLFDSNDLVSKINDAVPNMPPELLNRLRAEKSQSQATWNKIDLYPGSSDPAVLTALTEIMSGEDQALEQAFTQSLLEMAYPKQYKAHVTPPPKSAESASIEASMTKGLRKILGAPQTQKQAQLKGIMEGAASQQASQAKQPIRVQITPDQLNKLVSKIQHHQDLTPVQQHHAMELLHRIHTHSITV